MVTVKIAYTTKELIRLIGISQQAIDKRAKREGWASRPRTGRGGGNEWMVESMPEATRLIIAAAIANNIAQKNAQNSTCILSDDAAINAVNTLANVPQGKRTRASARALIVRMAREYGAASGVTRTAAYEMFAQLYRKGKLDVPAWAKQALPKISRTSLCDWETALNAQGVAALVDKHGQHRKGSGIIDSTPGMADCVIAEIVEFYEASATSVMQALEAKFAGQRLPDLRSLQRWMKQYRFVNEQVLKNIQNPDGWRSKYMSAAGSRSAGIERINQLWELDSSPTDIILADGTRYTLIGCIDVKTRRAVLHLAKTSSSAGVCALFRRAILRFGIPEGAKMDNGADYTGLQVTTVVHDLKISAEYCTPFSPYEKPHIERFFKTFQHSFVERLAGYIGHSVADRKAIESRRSFADRVSRKQGEKAALELRYTVEEFQKLCDDWTENVYGESLHSSLGQSPNDAAAQAEGSVQRISDERALDILLMPLAGNQGIRRIGKKGLRVDGGVYNAALLGGLEGEEVQVRRDEHDAGYVYVFDLDGIFVCRAEDPQLTGVSMRELSLARSAHQKAVIGRKVKEAKRIVAQVKPHEHAALILEHRAQQAAVNRARRTEAAETSDYTTPALDQAALAARAADRFVVATPETPAEIAARAALEAELLANIPHVEVTPQDLASREALATALMLEKKQADGETLTPAQTRWLYGYQSTNHYGAWRNMYDDFGPSMLEGVEAFAI